MFRYNPINKATRRLVSNDMRGVTTMGLLNGVLVWYVASYHMQDSTQ